MAGLFVHSSSNNAATTPAALGISVSTSVYGLTLPIIYGATRVPGNMIWYGAFTAEAQYTQGIYVRMVDFAIEGMVHMRNLTDDYYEYDEATYSLIGKRRKKRLQIGQRVKVKVNSVDINRRTIDLVLEENTPA